MTTPCIKSARSHAWIRLPNLQSQELLNKFTAFVAVIDDPIVALFVLYVSPPSSAAPAHQ